MPPHPPPAELPAQPINLLAADEGEELQRAELYGLLAQLWLAAPDAAMLQQFAVAVTQAPEPGSFLEAPWQDLVNAMRITTVGAVRAEYEALFLSASKAEILLYASHHVAGALNDKPLVELRRDLQALGLSGAPSATDTEDHVAFVLEVMRYLIAGDDVAVCNLERQRIFFRQHVQPWMPNLLCDAVERHALARVYGRLAVFTRAFLQVETQGFDLIE